MRRRRVAVAATVAWFTFLALTILCALLGIWTGEQRWEATAEVFGMCLFAGILLVPLWIEL